MDSMRNYGRTPLATRIAGALCIAIVALAPLAVGGNRPQWWLAFGAAIFMAAAISAAGAAVTGRDLRTLWRSAPALMPLYLALIIGLCLHTALVGGVASDVDAVYGLLRQLSYAALAWTLLQAISRESRAQSYATALICVMLAFAVYGLVTIERVEFLLYDKDAYAGVATGPFINRNSFATFMAMGASLALACAMADETGLARRHRQARRGGPVERRLRAVLLSAVALLCLATVYATASRMGLFVTLIGGVVVIGLRIARMPLRAGRGGRVAALAALLGLLSLAAVSLLYGGAVADRLGSTADSASVRIALYRNILEMIAANPLLGVGLDNFVEAFRIHHRLPVSPDLNWNLAHNTYLALWAELGLLLGSLPILILSLAAVALLRRSLGSETTPTSHLSDAALAAIVIAAIHSLVDFSLEMPANAYLLISLIILGLGPAAWGRGTGGGP